MRLLVTRPEPDATATAQRLRAAGHQVLVQPLLTVTFNAPPSDVPTPAAILITSQNGVRALAGWPQRAAWQKTPVFVAGPATARAVTDLGFTEVRAGARDAGSLVDVVLKALSKEAGRLLYVAALDRTGALADALSARGYDVRTVVAYRADPVQRLDAEVRSALAGGSIDGILLYSRRTASALLDVAKTEGLAAKLGERAYYVISEHVAEVVRGLGGAIHVADHPDEDSLLALIPPAG